MNNAMTAVRTVTTSLQATMQDCLLSALRNVSAKPAHGRLRATALLAAQSSPTYVDIQPVCEVDRDDRTMRHDRLVLTLLRRELSAGLRSTRRRDLVWIAAGGGALFAYAVADIVVALQATSATLRQAQMMWTVGLPAALLLLGTFTGSALARLCLSRAFAPFLRALPLSLVERRRMAATAACVPGVLTTFIVAAAVGLGCFVIAKPLAHAWGLGAAILFGAGLHGSRPAPAQRSRSGQHRHCPSGERSRRTQAFARRLRSLDADLDLELGLGFARRPRNAFMAAGGSSCPVRSGGANLRFH
ncbi:hypothetical protein [Mesorhizobium sp. B2-4-2]|uniref:hypothetical protein n=1 Tax=Mesorhizobium sp. B2-4-2 TaxID=2589947 RepID=UPI001FF015B0|nr:hypothetical protein [Mesorhizobium sp. B2-4-2]